MLGQHLGQPRLERHVIRPGDPERRGAGAELERRPHRDDRRRQALGNRRHDALGPGAGSVDLVDEHEGRDAQPLERAHEDAGLRLHAFHRGDHEYCAVEDAQDALHLRDEIGVPRRVDQVDGDVVDRERDDGRPDGDPALAFQRQVVGLCAAVVDAPRRVDDTGRVEQPLCESRLTGVYMRQDSQVQRSSHQRSHPSDRSQTPSRWT